MVTEFIELNRTFSVSKLEDLEEKYTPRFLNSLFSKDEEKRIFWADVLKHEYVVIQGAAGSGKTSEVLNQSKLIRENGGISFVLRIEDLQNCDPSDAVHFSDIGGKESLLNWKNSGGKAVIFLDALDEARLPNALNSDVVVKALRNLEKAYSSIKQTSRIIITTRGGEWKMFRDPELVSNFDERIKLRSKNKVIAPKGLERALNRDLEIETNYAAEVEFEKPKKPKLVKVYDLDSLSANSISKLLIAKEIDAPRFMQAISSSKTSDLLRQPIDVMYMIDLWKDGISKGLDQSTIFRSRLEVFEKTCSKKIQYSSDEKRRSELGSTISLNACQKIAAVSLLCGERNISAKKIDNTKSVSAINVLDNDLESWSEMEVRQLLSSSIFHPAIGEVIRFSHPELLDFLAANFFSALIDKNAGFTSLYEDLISRGIATQHISNKFKQFFLWLATFNENVRKRIIEINPLLLLSGGDPALLSPSEKRKILDGFTANYEGREALGNWLSQEDLEKFALPELEADIIELLGNSTSDELKENLIRILKTCKANGALDAILAIFEFDGNSHSLRETAVEAIFEIDVTNTEQNRIQAVFDRLVVPPSLKPQNAYHWNQFIFSIIKYLYRGKRTFDNFLIALEMFRREAKNVSSSTRYIFRDFIELFDDQELLNLLDIVVAKFISGREQSGLMKLRLNEDYLVLAKELRGIILRLLRNGYQSVDNLNFLDAIELIYSAQDEIYFKDYDDQLSKIDDEINAILPLKIALIEHRSGLFPDMFSQIQFGYSLFKPYISFHGDFEKIKFGFNEFNFWIGTLLGEPNQKRRLYIYNICDTIVHRLHDKKEHKTAIKLLLKTAKKYDIQTAIENNKFSIRQFIISEFEKFRWGRFQRIKTRFIKVKKEAIECYWKQYNKFQFWKNSKNLRNGKAIGYLQWVTNRDINNLNSEIIAKIKSQYGEKTAADFIAGFKLFWRTCDFDDVNDGTINSYVAILGLNLEKDLNAKINNSDEARRAIFFAFRNLNGFPIWLDEVAISHVSEFIEVSIDKLSSAINEPLHEDHYNSRAISHLYYAKYAINNLVSSDLFRILKLNLPNNNRDLDMCLHIISQSQTIQLNEIEQFLHEGLVSALRSFEIQRAWIWADALLDVNSELALRELISFFHGFNSNTSKKLFVGFLGREGLRRYRSDDIPVRQDWVENVETLKQLIKLAYKCFPPSMDPQHETAHGMGLYEYAEQKRRQFANLLVETKSKAGYEAFKSLASDVELIEFKDTFLWYADNLDKASITDPTFSIEEAINFVNRFDKRPTNFIEMRDLISRHISSLLYKLRNNDDDEGRVFRNEMGDENDLSNWLSARLREVGTQLYTVTREQQNAAQNRPDIRIDGRLETSGQYPIEVKLAEKKNWSGPELARRLETQLFNDYMREANSRHGFFVLVNASSKNFIKVIDGRRLNFDEFISLMKEKAAHLNLTLPDGKTVQVIGIELPIKKRNEP